MVNIELAQFETDDDSVKILKSNCKRQLVVVVQLQTGEVPKPKSNVKCRPNEELTQLRLIVVPTDQNTHIMRWVQKQENPLELDC